MKPLYLFLGALLFLATITGASASLTNNLLLYYANDNAGQFVDSLGRYNGTTNGSTYNATGKINGAYNFPITGGFVNVSDNINLRLVGTSYAINFWIYPQSVPSPTIGRIINKDDAADFSGGYGIYTSDRNLSWSHNTGSDNNWVSTFRFTEDNWVMVTAVYDTVANQRYFYINGTLHSNRTTTSDITTETDTFFINGWGPGPASAPGQYGNFVIDEVGVWNRSLNSSEITQLYNSFSGLAYPFGAINLSITSTDSYNGTAIQSFNATVVWNGTTTTYSTTTGTITTTASINSTHPANVTVTPTQTNYFSLPQTFTNYNTISLVFNATPYTLVRAYAFNGTLIQNFSANWTGPSYTGSGSTTNGTLYVPVYNGTYEVTIFNANQSGVNYSRSSANLTGSPYLQAYNFTGLLLSTSLYISFRDEDTGNIINGTNITLFVTGSSASYNYTTTNGFVNATLINPQNYTLTYFGGAYTQRELSIELGEQEAINLVLYLLQNSSGTYVRFTVLDQTYQTLPNATINANRKNLSGTNYFNIQDCTTDSNGECLMFLETLTATYRFVTEYQDITRTSGDTVLSRDTYTIVINTGTSTLQNVLARDDIQAGLNYTPVGSFYYTVNDPSNLVTSGELVVERRYGGRFLPVSSTSGSGSSFTLSITGVNVTLGDEIVAKGYVFVDGERILTHTISVIESPAGTALGTGLAFLFLGMAFTIVFIFAWNPVAPLVAFAAFLVVMSRIGLVAMGGGAVVAVLIVVGVAIYRMRSV